jgi:tetratricopeptide (TPR) repeat protein
MNESAIFGDIVAALRSGNPVEAERLSRDILAQAPTHIDALVALALSLHAQRRSDDAIAAFRHLTQVQPGEAMHWNNYATALHEAGRGDEAETAWRKAMALDPRDPEPRIQVGLLLQGARNTLPPATCCSTPSNSTAKRRAPAFLPPMPVRWRKTSAVVKT